MCQFFFIPCSNAVMRYRCFKSNHYIYINIQLGLVFNCPILFLSAAGIIMICPGMQLKLFSFRMGWMGVFYSETATKDLTALLCLSGKKCPLQTNVYK